MKDMFSSTTTIISLLAKIIVPLHKDSVWLLLPYVFTPCDLGIVIKKFFQCPMNFIRYKVTEEKQS
jgi:hypothetical protein